MLRRENEYNRVLMLEAYGLSDRGCVRPNNEDYFLISPDMGLYLVADGMGGAQAGEHASKLAVETVAEHIWNVPNPGIEALEEAFRKANERVLKLAQSDRALEGMGTTLVGVLETKDGILIASVGDSRAYLFENSRLTCITEDQTWVNEVGRRLGIDEDSLKTHPMRHVLTMAIGSEGKLRIHSYACRPRVGAQFLLCSDGLHGVVEPAEIERVLSSEQSLAAKCHYLIEAAKEAGGPDNITVVLLRVLADA